MGGNCLKNCVTRRFEAKEYFEMESFILSELEDLFPLCKITPIKAYKLKASFGDADILIDNKYLPSDWVETVVSHFKSKEYRKNGNVLSLEVSEMQVDLISTKPEEFKTSYNYFNYNDLGNLFGRLANSLNLKLGHDGLSYNFRDGTYHFRNVVLLTDWKDILPVLGLSYERYAEGFDTLEDIFKFVVSSPFFHKDIFHLENRNHAARVRDEKRKTYMDFLKWIESYEETFLQITSSEFNRVYGKDKSRHLYYLFSVIPNFNQIHEEVTAEWQVDIKFKTLYNGDLVKELTGLDGKELGAFMKFCKEDQPALKKMITTMNPDCFEEFVKYLKQKYDGELPIVDLNIVLAEDKNGKV